MTTSKASLPCNLSICPLYHCGYDQWNHCIALTTTVQQHGARTAEVQILLQNYCRETEKYIAPVSGSKLYNRKGTKLTYSIVWFECKLLPLFVE